MSATGTINERIASASNCRKDDYTTGAENTRNDYLFGTYSYGKDGANNTSDVKLYLFERAKINPAGFPTVLEKNSKTMTMRMDGQPYFMISLKGRRPKEVYSVFDIVPGILHDFEELLEEEQKESSQKIPCPGVE